MKAAYLYDWREKNMLISGNELAMLFAEVLGDPSPAGKTPIDLDALKQVANDNVGYPMGAWAQNALDVYLYGTTDTSGVAFQALVAEALACRDNDDWSRFAHMVYEAGSSSRRLHESGQAFVARERANRIAFEARVREALAKHGLEW